MQREAAGPDKDEEEKKVQARLADDSIIQRKEAKKEDEEEKTVQTKVAPGYAFKVSSSAESGIESLRGGGRPLSPSLRAFYEPRFGHDFSRVRVHHDAQAAASARAINAHAYTIGRDIVFGPAQYAPGTSSGQRLLAHELTHVVQQTGRSGANGPAHGLLSKSNDRLHTKATVFRSPAATSSPSSAATSIPADLKAEIDSLMERTGGKPKEADLERLGRLAAGILGPKGVTSLARKAGVKGAERRDEEVDGSTEGTIQRQAAEAAGGVAATMWWLTLVDGPLPIGDIIYGALILGAAITATAAADAIRRSCSKKLTACLENPWQPDWNRGDFGPRKDCSACYRECVLAAGIWPDYKCPR